MTSQNDDAFCLELEQIDPLLLNFSVIKTDNWLGNLKNTLASLSFIGYTFMFLSIYFTPKVQVHPMKLFMVYAFFGASTFWLYVLKWLFNCKFFYSYIKLIWFCDVNDEDCLSSL